MDERSCSCWKRSRPHPRRQRRRKRLQAKHTLLPQEVAYAEYEGFCKSSVHKISASREPSGVFQLGPEVVGKLGVKWSGFRLDMW